MTFNHVIQGDDCPECHAEDTFLEYGPVENCSCHIHPPCSACVNNPLVCPTCGWEDD